MEWEELTSIESMWRQSLRLSQQSHGIQTVRNWLSQTVSNALTQLKSHPESADYLIWRHQFLQKRLRLGLLLGILWDLISRSHAIYYVFFEFDNLSAYVQGIFGDASIAILYRDATLVACVVSITLLVMCWVGQQTSFGKRYSAMLFLFFACSIGQIPEQIIGTFFGLPLTPDNRTVLALALLIPVHWRLHLISQILPIAYYAIVYPVIGLTTLGTTDTFKLYSMGTIIEIAWVFSVSNLAVYLYERLKRSEFETHRQLQMFLHSVSHDLRTPVIGSSIVLKSLLGQSTTNNVHKSDTSDNESNDSILVKRSALARLLQGSDRQLTLIESLLEAHTTELQGVVLHPEPIQLKPVVDSVLLDLQHLLTKKHIGLHNHITDDLPLVNADPNQLWRVLSNLIGNALKHNPHEIELTLEAGAVEPGQKCRKERGSGRLGRGKLFTNRPKTQPQVPMLLLMVQDTGIGIAPEQCSQLFELYARGAQARYMPGLGLGLYLCKQIIEAHGGEIGVVSQVGKGATFWFTLPLYPG